jgi:hypothetical protein
MLNMADLFGSGPFLDAADDFSSRIRCRVTNAVTEIGVAAQYSLFYRTEQVEGGRTRFGR